ncbi:carbohydrate ABC transporter permease [Hungatella sp. L12]|uniref:Carbohydrate ABC transporter permease n=1 Tax=Hungatella hominis TaxID=2763050 RepID=A0ABR7H822_9FIRM|nr:carbohydrate ABC transporter permease [Hungatella hominis]MBC5709302.1 carbohydrate ABC transporter permease [Hungatella hominis]
MLRMKLGRPGEDRIINIVTSVLCILVLIVTVYPVYYCLIYSFNDGKDAAKQAIYFWPRKFSLENYKIVFQNKAIYPAFMMTMLRSIVGTVLAVLCMAMAGYALSKDNLKGRKVYMIMGVITLYFSAGVVQSYLLYREMRLLDSFWVYILPNIFQFYYIILFISFFRELPAALEESAQMDGAGYFTILFKIIIPLSTPVIATVSLFVGVWHWNDWFHPAFFIQNESLMTLPAVLMRAMSLAEAQQTLQKMIAVPSQSSTTMESVRYAMLIVSILPVTIIYPFVQKFFLKGMMLGAVKE